ncbi:MAG: hypothetical protein ACYTFK_06090 [Planctomycetota bacterium]|jgi:septal ring factor EnvC (AmiA/AmiB activator)
MKAILPSVLLLAGFLGLINFISGCQEEPKPTDRRRARLVFDENLKLKEQLQLCNQKIQEQKDSLAQYEKEKADNQEYMNNFIREQTKDPMLLKILDETGKKLEELALENTVLKDKIEELEAKLD